MLKMDDLQDWKIMKFRTTKENQSESEYTEWNQRDESKYEWTLGLGDK